ncbi:unnamed protein product [Phyllotreta striolata]|uniref:N-acetyltransferase domain-containing protein n=1 Tax=Phyllotreta striolata TaxID=444603 RepID=A0A9N9XLM3_PHYSR|nr:unnamed protein product [Phyllotreta striolata]
MVSRCRRYTREVERIRALDDAGEEQDYLEVLKEKEHTPIVWGEPMPGVKIIDLQEQRYKEAFQFICDVVVPEDVVLKSTRLLDDPESLEAFEEKVIFIMRDRTSMIAVNEENEIVGILVMKVVRKFDFSKTFSQLQVRRGKIFLTIMKFYNNVYKETDVFEKLQVDMYLRLYWIGVRHSYRRNKIGHQMMWCSLDLLKSLNLNGIMALLTTAKLQATAHYMGMDSIYTYFYSRWRDLSETLIFRGIGGGNYCCALMAGYINYEKVIIEKE